MRFPDDTALCVIHDIELVPFIDPRIGSTIAGRYVIESILGEGGMTTVYKARQKLADRNVAIKVMNPMLATDAKVLERFRREAKHAARLAHPNIIEIFEQGDTEDGTAYIVMELLLGVSLSTLVSQGPMDVDRAIGIMIQCARALARAHDFDVIHRDLKPENIFICKRDDGSDLVKLLDFGIARSLHDGRLTGQGELFGTPQYMSPGRIKGNDTTRADDLYAIGVLFFEMLTGQLPFDAPDVATFFIKHLTEKPRQPLKLNPKIPPALNDLVLRLLAKDEKGRPVDAHSVEADLLVIANERALAAPPSITGDPDLPPPPATLREGAGEAWGERLRVAEAILTRAFGEPSLAPTDLAARFRALQSHNAELERLRESTLDAERELSQIEQRGREARQRIGFAVDALGQDTSRARAELRDAEEAAERLEADEVQFVERFKLAHSDMMRLEGRFAFQNPMKALSDAYRRAAEVLDAWRAMRVQVDARKEQVAQKIRAASDLDFQINQLRSALMHQEEKSEAERNAAAAELEAREKVAARLEVEMMDQLRGLVLPLRPRPDVANLVADLDRTLEVPKGSLPPRGIGAARAAV